MSSKEASAIKHNETTDAAGEGNEISVEKLATIIHALLFVSGASLSAQKLAKVIGTEEDKILVAIDLLSERLSADQSPLYLKNVSGGYQLRTKAEYAPYIKNLKKNTPKRLSKQALETLAVIAYRQPIVKSDIEAIRGVDVTPTLKTLLSRRLIKIIGYKQTVGQPALYGTTDYFLEVFGLNSLRDLPSIKELAEIENDLGEEPDGCNPLEKKELSGCVKER